MSGLREFAIDAQEDDELMAKFGRALKRFLAEEGGAKTDKLPRWKDSAHNLMYCILLVAALFSLHHVWRHDIVRYIVAVTWLLLTIGIRRFYRGGGAFDNKLEIVAMATADVAFAAFPLATRTVTSFIRNEWLANTLMNSLFGLWYTVYATVMPAGLPNGFSFQEMPIFPTAASLISAAAMIALSRHKDQASAMVSNESSGFNLFGLVPSLFSAIIYSLAAVFGVTLLLAGSTLKSKISNLNYFKAFGDSQSDSDRVAPHFQAEVAQPESTDITYEGDFEDRERAVDSMAVKPEDKQIQFSRLENDSNSLNNESDN